jgi:cellulose synthase operon protein C
MGVLAKEAQNIDAMLELSRLAARRNNAADTLRWLEKAESVSGNNLRPGLQLIEHHLQANRPDRAREVLRGLQGKAPDALAVLITGARVQLANADVAAAKSTLNRAAAVANFDAASLVQIAQLQMQAGNLPGAWFALDKALSEKPDHLNARALMADVELRQGDAGKAEARARALLASHPKQGIGHALLGDVAMARGQRPAAVDAYRRAHEIDRNSASALRLFSALQVQSPAAANPMAEQWLKARPNDTAMRRALVHSHARAGNLSAARSHLEALLKAAPGDADALNDLANILILQRDPAALQTAERALALKPDAPYVIGTTGWAAFRAGQADRALQLLRDARLRDPNNADTRYFLGAVLADRGRQAEAREELKGALGGSRVTAYAKEAEALLRTLN